MMKKNLVIVRAGDDSKHESWLPNDSEANWDLIVSYYGNKVDAFRLHCLYRDDIPGPKYPAIASLLSREIDAITSYDYVMFPDDDLETDAITLSNFFDICGRFDLQIAQPALAPGSYYSHPVTLKNAAFLLRHSNLIEIMTPCFKGSFLRKCSDTFSETVSGWGLDWIWPNLADNHRRTGIVDATPIHHRRPLGGPMHGYFARIGIDPHDEMHALLRAHGLRHSVGYSTGGVDLKGNFLSDNDATRGDLLKNLIQGYLDYRDLSSADFMALIEGNLKRVGVNVPAWAPSHSTKVIDQRHLLNKIFNKLKIFGSDKTRF